MVEPIISFQKFKRKTWMDPSGLSSGRHEFRLCACKVGPVPSARSNQTICTILEGALFAPSMNRRCSVQTKASCRSCIQMRTLMNSKRHEPTHCDKFIEKQTRHFLLSHRMKHTKSNRYSLPAASDIYPMKSMVTYSKLP